MARSTASAVTGVRPCDAWRHGFSESVHQVEIIKVETPLTPGRAAVEEFFVDRALRTARSSGSSRRLKARKFVIGTCSILTFAFM